MVYCVVLKCLFRVLKPGGLKTQEPIGGDPASDTFEVGRGLSIGELHSNYIRYKPEVGSAERQGTIGKTVVCPRSQSQASALK